MPGMIRAKKSGDLTDRERRFCREYTIDFNQKRAAIVSGYAKTNAAAMGSRLLTKPHIQQEIRRITHLQLAKTDLKLERVIERIAEIAFRDVLDLCDDDGIIRLDRLDHIPAQMRHCIDGLKVRHLYDKDGEVIGQTIEIKLSPIQGALDMLMKYFGAYQAEKHEVAVKINWDDAYKKPSIEDQRTVVIDVPKLEYKPEELFNGDVGQ